VRPIDRQGSGGAGTAAGEAASSAARAHCTGRRRKTERGAPRARFCAAARAGAHSEGGQTSVWGRLESGPAGAAPIRTPSVPGARRGRRPRRPTKCGERGCLRDGAIRRRLGALAARHPVRRPPPPAAAPAGRRSQIRSLLRHPPPGGAVRGGGSQPGGVASTSP
jgi:hypothetical protein